MEATVAGNIGYPNGIPAENVVIQRDTPLEYFEGQVQQYLVENETGMSLADVPYTGPLRAPVIDTLPVGLGSATDVSGTPVEYGTYASLIDSDSANYATNAQALTYRFRFSVISTSPWANETFNNGHFIQYDRVEQWPATHFSTDVYAFHTHGRTEWNLVTTPSSGGQMSFELYIDGVDGTPDYSGTRMAAGPALTPKPRLYIGIFEPGDSVSALPPDFSTIFPTTERIPALESFAEDGYTSQLLEPDSTYAVGIDLNQYSKADVDVLADRLRNEVGTSGPDSAYDEFATLSVAEFLFEKNQSLRQVADLMSARYQSSYGVVIAESANTQITENFPVYDISTSPYGSVPSAFELNELQQTARFIDLSSSDTPVEASQLGVWQASSDQAEVQEKLLAADSSKSTLRILQRAFAGQQAYITDGPNITLRSTGNTSVQVYETTVNADGKVQVLLLGDARASNAIPGSEPGVSYDNPNSTPQHPTVWTSANRLIDINSEAILTTERNSLKSDLNLHLSTFSVNYSNAALTHELGEYLSESLTVQDGVGRLSDTRVLMPNLQLSLGGWEGSAFFGERLDTGYGTYVVDRFGDDELTGYVASFGRNFPQIVPPGSSAQIADALVGSASGNVTSNATDILFPNIGVPLNFSRTYSSNYEIQLNSGQTQVDRDMGLGLGWMHRFGDRLYVDNPDTSNPDLVWFRSTGQAHRIAYIGNEYVVPTELLGQFKTTPEGFEYLERDGMRYAFERTIEDGNTAGNIYATLSGITDRSDNGFEIVYDGGTVDHIQSVRDVHDSDRKLEFDYAQQGTDTNRFRITNIRKYDNGSLVGTWDYQYVGVSVPNTDPTETTWHLNTVTTPQESVVPGGFVTTYDYYDPDDSGPDGADAYAGLLKKITSPNLDYRIFEYYLNRRKFREITSANQSSEDFDTTTKTYSYNPVANTTDITDERGNVTTLSYQPNGLQLRKINPDRTRSVNTWGEVDTPEEFLIKSSTDEVGATESYEYFTDSDVIAETASDFEVRQLKQSESKRFLKAAMATLLPVPTRR